MRTQVDNCWVKCPLGCQNTEGWYIRLQSRAVLALIQVWISNHMPSKVQDETIYPFPNCNGYAVEVWEWISNFIPYFMIWFSLGFKLSRVNKSNPCSISWNKCRSQMRYQIQRHLYLYITQITIWVTWHIEASHFADSKTLNIAWNEFKMCSCDAIFRMGGAVKHRVALLTFCQLSAKRTIDRSAGEQRKAGFRINVIGRTRWVYEYSN